MCAPTGGRRIYAHCQIGIGTTPWGFRRPFYGLPHILKSAVGRGHPTPPPTGLAALRTTKFATNPISHCRGRRPRRPGRAQKILHICWQLRDRAAISGPRAACSGWPPKRACGRRALWPPRGLTPCPFRLCMGNHPSVTCGDSAQTAPVPSVAPRHLPAPRGVTLKGSQSIVGHFLINLFMSSATRLRNGQDRSLQSIL